MSHASHVSCAQVLLHCLGYSMSTMAAKMTVLEAVGQSCLCMKVAAALAPGLAWLVSLHQRQPFCGCVYCSRQYHAMHQEQTQCSAHRCVDQAASEGFSCTGGLLAAEAVEQLRQFYAAGNPNGKARHLACLVGATNCLQSRCKDVVAVKSVQKFCRSDTPSDTYHQ